MTTFEEVLDRDGRLVYKTRGCSMLPLLRQERDLVIIEPPAGRLRRLDVALYKRGGKYILHRVVRVGDGVYYIRGDNTYLLETVPDSAVLGVLTGFQRNGKTRSVRDRGYRLYARLWNGLYPLRLVRYRLRRALVGLARRLGLLPWIRKVLHRE